MSLGHGISIPRNGLIYSIDSSNLKKSWKGKPTTNHAKFPFAKDDNGVDTLTNWAVFGFGDDNTLAVSSETPAVGSGNSVEVIANTTSFSTVNNSNTDLVGLNLNDQITVSWYAKGVGRTIGKGVRIWAYANSPDGAVSTGLTDLGPLTKDWQRFTYTYTWTKATPSNSSFVTYIRVATSPGDTFLVSNPQVEVGTIASPFIDGTRSNTESIIDLQGNYTNTIQSLTYNADGTFDFNGTSDYFQTGLIGKYSNYSIEFWIKITGSTGTQQRFFSSTSGGTHTVRYIDGANFDFHYNPLDGDPPSVVAPGTTVAQQNVWYHVVATNNINTQAKIYVNGVLEGTNEPAIPLNGTCFFGCDKTLTLFSDCVLDVSRIYDRELTQTEISELFESRRGRYEV